MENDTKVFSQLARRCIGDSYRWLLIATSLYIVNKLVGAYVETFKTPQLLLENTDKGYTTEASKALTSVGYATFMLFIVVLVGIFYIVAYLKKRRANNALLMSQLASATESDYLLLQSHTSGIGRWMVYFLLMALVIGTVVSYLMLTGYVSRSLQYVAFFVYGVFGLIFWLTRRARFYDNKPFFDSSIPAYLK